MQHPREPSIPGKKIANQYRNCTVPHYTSSSSSKNTRPTPKKTEAAPRGMQSKPDIETEREEDTEEKKREPSRRENDTGREKARDPFTKCSSTTSQSAAAAAAEGLRKARDYSDSFWLADFVVLPPPSNRVRRARVYSRGLQMAVERERLASEEEKRGGRGSSGFSPAAAAQRLSLSLSLQS